MKPRIDVSLIDLRNPTCVPYFLVGYEITGKEELYFQSDDASRFIDHSLLLRLQDFQHAPELEDRHASVTSGLMLDEFLEYLEAHALEGKKINGRVVVRPFKINVGISYPESVGDKR